MARMGTIVVPFLMMGLVPCASMGLTTPPTVMRGLPTWRLMMVRGTGPTVTVKSGSV